MSRHLDPIPAPSTSEASPSVYYDAAQLRSDTWNRLKDQTTRLEEYAGNGKDGSQLRIGIARALELLRPIESYWAFPGKTAVASLLHALERGQHDLLARQTAHFVRLLVSDEYRRRDLSALRQEAFKNAQSRTELDAMMERSQRHDSRPYFEVLVVDDLSVTQEEELRLRLIESRREDDDYIYDVVVVPSLEDAVIAVLFNHNIQSCVLRYSFPFHSANQLELFRQYFSILDPNELEDRWDVDRAQLLARTIKRLRGELDLFLVTDSPVSDIAGNLRGEFRRVFYRQEDYLELHLSILKGISERFETPFFTALRNYSLKPTGVFHALPISRGKSIVKSHWIQDMGQFYGTNVFLAETSATGGGLDSLLQPHGPLKRAQELAARAFGARKTFFVTNGTSTANKIVVQALVRPGDIVLASHDCHKSHHYALLLAGAFPVYLDAYPLTEFGLYGAVPLSEIKRQLLELKAAGKLERVKMLLLTNCTFDGITYDSERVMNEVLAIKPDMIFLWDEAWFAFATFVPTLRRRTAMEAANRLRRRYRSEEYRQQFDRWKSDFARNDLNDPRTWLESPLMPDPDRVRVRAYATQSTHKTLTALRQGSMIHINDQDYEQKVSDAFREAYMTHTSTSPNYQILASLDVGRRQVEFEGYELVQKSVELAMTVRQRILSHPLLRRYFRLLGAKDLIPDAHRPSGLEYYYDPRIGWSRMEEAWRTDEFTLDPTRITVHVGRAGITGDAFKRLLMDEHDIQINKTSLNTVLFMIHIGMTRGTVTYLIEVLLRIAQELDRRMDDQSAVERRLHQGKVSALTRDLPPLPNFSRFHRGFLPDDRSGTPEGDIRSAFFLAYDDERCEYLRMDDVLAARISSGEEVVSAGFVTPYPPGFPVLVPGQVISPEILTFLRATDVKEIHGYKPEYGLRVFTAESMTHLRPVNSPSNSKAANVPGSITAGV